MQLTQLILATGLLFSMASTVAEACLPLIIPAIVAVGTGVGVFAGGRKIGETEHGGRPDVPEKGCFADSPNKRDMGNLVLSGGNMTHVLCTDMCRQSESKYMGLQDGTDCYCSNEYNRFKTEVPTSKCNKPCKGNPKENCGGYLANYVIQLTGLEH